MKVKTFKRMSKRFISTLLSVLMVVSLFTVCAVGSAVTASAASISSGVTIYFDNSAIKFSSVYLHIGHGSYATSYKMDPIGETGKYKYTFSGSWDGFSSLFFANASVKNTGSIDNDKNAFTAGTSRTNTTSNSVSSNTLFTAAANGSLTSKTVNVTTTDYYMDATMFNYRNNDQTNRTNAPSTDESTKYGIDTANGMASSVKNGKMYSHYNEGVESWFEGNEDALEDGQHFTPLYVGNFHDLASDSGFPSGLYNWVKVANAANRKDGADSDSIKSSAQGLVSNTLSNMENLTEGVPTQFGVELPQFSDKFTTDNPKLQTKYSNLKFQAIATKDPITNNIWYSYDSSKDGNRYLNLSDRKVKKGNSVHGYTNELLHAGTNGYFPFNKSQPSNGNDVINGHGTRFDVTFTMPSDGTGTVNGEPLQFTFSGDDDLWVFIDGYLALDLGGSHSKAKGSINLASDQLKATITTGVYPSAYDTVESKSSSSSSYTSGTVNQAFSTELKAALADTTKEHTMSIFYMERGQYNSNLSFEFMLPQTDSLKIEQKIDTTAVNEGLLKETLNTADKDAHEVILKSNSISATKNDTAEIPVVSDFKRVDADGAYALLQHGTGDITNASGEPFKNTTTGGMVTAGTTTFVWEDANANYGNSKKSFGTGTGIVGDNGEVDLLYNQTATFNDQFVLGSKFQLIPQNALKTFIVGKADSENPPATKETTRTVSKYYTQTSSITDNEGNPIKALDSNGNVITGTATDNNKYYSFGTADANSAKIKATYTNTVNTGTIQFTKKLDEGSDTTTSFKFSVEFANIFGGNDTDAFDEYSIIYKIKNTNGTESEEKTYSTANGIVLKVGETAIIEGVPVDTTYRIIEEGVSGTSKIYSVANVTKGDNNVDGAADKLESTKGGIVATVGTVAAGKSNIAHLNFINTTKTTTVVYRFNDRNMTSGLPTAMETHYTYFTREIPGTITNNEAGRSIIEQYAPTIKNLMKTYSLNKDEILFNYTLTDADLLNAEGTEKIPKNEKLIVATYTPVTREYTVDVTCPDENGNYSSKAFTYEFNQLINLGEIRAPKTYTVGGTEYKFRYWAKLVNIDGTRASTYTPVSTNYSYSYRVTDHARIRAVYDKDFDFKQLEAPVVVDDADYNVSGPGSGYDASAAERVYDSYSKDVVKNSTVVSQDRTRVNVLFGAVGSKDIDENITEVGYILLQNQGKYATDNLFSDDVLKTYVPTDSGKLHSNDLTIDGNTYKARRKSYKVEGNGYIQNPDTGKWEEKYVAGEVNLTNKNRVNIVFDIINDGSNLEKYYTCYTFMKRVDYEYDENGNKISDDMKEYIYVSETPAYFNLHEAEPYIQEVETGGQSYPVVGYVRDTSGMINANAGNIKLSKQNIKDGQKLVITITPTNYVSNGKTMESKLKSLKIGTIEIAEEDFGSYTISKTDESVISIIFDDDSHLPKNYSSLEVTAVFEVKENSDYASVDTSAFTTEAGRVDIIVDGTNYGTSASVKKGTKFSLQAVANTNYVFTGWTGSVTGTTNPIEFTVDAEGEYGTLPTPQFAECIDISGATYELGSVQLSTSKNGTYGTSIKLVKGTEQKFYAKAVPNTGYQFKEWTGTATGTTNPVELTFNADGTYDTIPTPVFEVKHYNVTIKAQTGGSVTYSYTGQAETTITAGSSTTLSLPAGTVLSLKATLTDATNYKFNGWSTGASNNTISYTVNSDITITANFKKNATVIYFVDVAGWGYNSLSLKCSLAGYNNLTSFSSLSFVENTGKTASYNGMSGKLYKMTFTSSVSWIDVSGNNNQTSSFGSIKDGYCYYNKNGLGQSCLSNDFSNWKVS